MQNSSDKLKLRIANLTVQLRHVKSAALQTGCEESKDTSLESTRTCDMNIWRPGDDMANQEVGSTPPPSRHYFYIGSNLQRTKMKVISHSPGLPAKLITLDLEAGSEPCPVTYEG